MKNTLKTIISTVLCYLMVLSVIPMGAFTASAAITGSGTQASPYLVSTAADFENALALYNEEGVYIKLKANITLGSSYVPGSFNAVLDGDFYKITAPVNLFYSNSGTIKNLYFECSTSDLAFSDTYGGLICERNSGTISGVIAKGSINCSCSHGISGDNGSSEATNVGFISGSSSGTIINCAGIGSVKTYCPYGSKAGGISSSGTAINCYVAGAVSASGSSRYGTSKSHPITLGTSDNCYYNSTLLSSTVSGGFTTSEMKTQSFVDKLNDSTTSTDSVWVRDTSSKNSGYPILKRSLDAQITSSKENILISGTEKIYLTCSDPDAKIYYNKSATVPTTSSTLYSSSGISISSTTTITAIAYKDGLYSMPYRFNYASVSGSGTVSSPYQINSEAALHAIVELGASAHYKLTQNLTLVGEIPCFDTFTGTFDGQGYSISNAYSIKLKSGLFKENYGIIKNLKINISTEKDYNVYGGIVRSNYGVVYNCSVSGNMNVGELAYSSYDFSSIMGGIVARNEGRVEKCSMSGNINVRQSDYTGGIVGYNKGVVEYCVFNGKIDVYSTSFNGHQGYVGGLVGANLNGAVIRYCDVVSTSIVGGCRNYSGVIVGELYGSNSGSAIDCTTSVSFIDWESNYCEFGTCAIVHGTGTTTGEARPDVHTHDYKVAVVEPTCAVGRLYNFVCTCGNISTYEVPYTYLGHDYGDRVYTQAIAPTCTEKGESRCYCSRCDYYLTQEIAATGHSYTSAVTKEASCSETGIRTYTCSSCGDSYENTIYKKSHTYDKTVIAPTCEEQGYTKYTCSVCSYTYNSSYVNATGHNMGEWEFIVEPDCTNGGSRKRVCLTDSTHVETEELDALGHDEIAHSAKAPTCTQIGWGSYVTCSRCDYTTYEEIPALGHDEVAHEAKPVTCLEMGWNEYVTCTRCDYTTYEEIPAKGHSLYRVEEKFATCEEIGWELHARCKDCDFSGFEEIPALGHLENEWQTVTAPTCTEAGLEKKICGRTIYAESIAEGSYPESEHNYSVNLEKDYTFSVESADELVLTFSSDSDLETNYDFLYIYDGDDNLIASYTGKKLASKEVVVPGNFVRLHLSTDHSLVKYGFRITNIKIRDTLFACDKVEEREIPATGHALVFVEAKAPTCGEAGWDAYSYCTSCDYTEIVEIPAINHGNKYTVEATAPTCTEAGYTEGVYCPDCAAFVGGHEELAATNHINKYIVEGLAATCTAAGYTSGIFCPDCDSFIEGHEDIAAKNHSAKYSVEAVAATCMAVGYTKGIFCPDCDLFLEGHEEIAIDAEAHKWNSGEITTVATCITEGIKTYTCQHNASHKKTENLGLNSANHVNTTDVDEVKATCTTVGYTAGVYCEDCEKYVSGHEEIAIDAEAHKWNDGEITTTATCITEGIRTYTCQHNASHKKTENLGVNSGNHVRTRAVAAIGATCITKGYTAGVYCDDCAKYISGHAEIAINPYTHKNTTKAPAVAATIQSVGYTEGVFCNDCKKYVSGHAEIPKLAPVFTDSSEAKVSGNDIVADTGIKAETLLTQASTGSVIRKLTGEVLGSGEAVGTGMTLIFADGTRKEIVVSGDADGDAKITSADARFALRAAVGLDECDEKTAFYKAANVDISDKLSAADARLILRASVGLEDPKKWAK